MKFQIYLESRKNTASFMTTNIVNSPFIISCQEAKNKINDLTNFLLYVSCKTSELNIQVLIIINQSIQNRTMVHFFNITQQPMTLWLVWNTSNDNTQQSVDHNLWHMSCERRWYRVNDPNTSLLVITKDNNFFELKSFLKYGHFACKPTG